MKDTWHPESINMLKMDVIYIVGICIIALFTANLFFVFCFIIYMKSSTISSNRIPSINNEYTRYEKIDANPTQSQSNEADYEIHENYKEISSLNVASDVQTEESLYSELIVPINCEIHHIEQDDENYQLYSMVLKN